MYRRRKIEIIMSNFWLHLGTLSWRSSLLCRNQSTDLFCKSMDWFLHDTDVRHERVKHRVKRTFSPKSFQSGAKFHRGLSPYRPQLVSFNEKFDLRAVPSWNSWLYRCQGRTEIHGDFLIYIFLVRKHFI